MTQYTPGPWRRTPGLDIVNADGEEICSIYLGGDSKIIEATTNLIVAAPIVLEALKKVRMYPEWPGIHHIVDKAINEVERPWYERKKN